MLSRFVSCLPDVPALSRDALSIFPPDEWEREKKRLVYESWVQAARGQIRNGR